METTKLVQEWIEAGRPYNEGLILLNKVSKNRNLRQKLARKQWPEKLEYELRKMANINKPVKSKLKAEKKRDEKGPGVNEIPESITGELTKSEDKKVDRDKLPDPMKPVYDEIRKLYTLRQSYHEKAKVFTSQNAKPETIAPLVKAIKDTNASIKEKWAIIDNYDPAKDQSKKSKTIDHKRIGANRKYISTNKNKLKTDPEKWLPKIQERIDELLQAQVEVSPQLLDELKEYGIKA